MLSGGPLSSGCTHKFRINLLEGQASEPNRRDDCTKSLRDMEDLIRKILSFRTLAKRDWALSCALRVEGKDTNYETIIYILFPAFNAIVFSIYAPSARMRIFAPRSMRSYIKRKLLPVRKLLTPRFFFLLAITSSLIHSAS